MKKHLFLIAFLALCCVKPSLAADRFDVMMYRPVTDGGAFFTVRDSDGLKPWQASFGLSLDFASRPLTAKLGTADVDIVNKYLAQHFFIGMGIAEWFSISADLPVVWLNRFRNPDTLPMATYKRGFGDPQFELKFRLLDRQKFPVGLAIAPFVSAPLGSEEIFVGEDGVSGGGRLIIAGGVGRRVRWGVNTGGLVRRRLNNYGLDLGSQFLASTAINVKVTELLSLVGEGEVRTAFDNFFGSRNVTPAEVRGGLQFGFGNRRDFILNTAGSWGVDFGSGASRYRLIASLSFLPEFKKGEAAEKVAGEKGPEEIFHRTVYFLVKRADLTNEAMNILLEVISFLSGVHPAKEVLIEGHTDDIGNSKFNFELGERRAKGVRDYLVKSLGGGFDVKTSSRGEDLPLDTNATAKGRAKNRRVEIIVR